MAFFLSLLQAALPVQLYASHYSGTVSVLSLTGSGSSYSLTEASNIRTCGSMPSWLTLDSTNRMLYCSDEAMFGTGSLSAISIGADGKLTQSAKVSATYGAVANVLYGGANGTGFVAIAHYQSSTLSTFRLPLTTSSTTQQSFKYTMSGPGANPSRQDAPHPHHVVVDPTGNFLLVPDLGADLVRIYSINKDSGQLTDCPSIKTTAGSGPRHATFWTPSSSARIRRQSSGTILYVANELANMVTVFKATYPASGCPTFSQIQAITPYPNNKTAPAGTKVAEVRAKGNFLYTTNRNDKAFSPNDSMTSFSISSTGSLTLLDHTSSFGTYPRTFDINKAGDLVAIGDQTTANVAIVKRDPSTGKLGDLIATLRIGAAGTPENEDGLSSVVFAA